MSYKALVHRTGAPIKAGETELIHTPTLEDSIPIAANVFHALRQGKGYRITVARQDIKRKIFTLRVNGRTYTITLKDQLDLQVEKMGMSNPSTARGGATLQAPMPGLILSLGVGIGDRVATGDPLLTLEAMKMENTLMAPASGIVKAVMAKQGDRVEKGQALLEIAAEA